MLSSQNDIISVRVARPLNVIALVSGRIASRNDKLFSE